MPVSAAAPGTLYAGTSGFSYASWAPLFYPRGTPSASLLTIYAARLPAVELNNTFYQQPRPERVAAWLRATPAAFRFAVKAQRGGSLRAFAGAARETVAWLCAPYRAFGERLGAVLFRVPQTVQRDDERLAALLEAWPAELPLAVEFQHPSWDVDEVHSALRRRGAALCATDLDAGPPPDVRLTGPFLYLRLRRTAYGDADIETWAQRLAPFVADGRDAFVFFRHDDDGRAGLNALGLCETLRRLVD